MDAREKARELIETFGKDLAIKCCEEIIKSNPCFKDSNRGGDLFYKKNSHYYQEIKQHIIFYPVKNLKL